MFSGFRYLIGGGNVSFAHSDIWHLFVYWGAFLALTLIYFLVRYRMQFRHDEPARSAAAETAADA